MNLRNTLIAAATFVAASSTASAATWSGVGADANWSTDANWDSVPAGTVALTFDGTTQLTNNDDIAGITASSITFNSGAGAFVLGGNAISLGGTIVNNSTSLETINNALALTANGTVNAASGDISLGGAITGAFTLTKSGTGKLTLSNSNTFTGDTTVSAGTLNLSSTLALQNSTLATGGVVFDQSVATHAFTLGGLKGAGAIALADNAGTPNAVALTVGNNNQSTTYSGILSGTGSLAKTGTGTLTLSGANTYSGGTTVNAGTLAVSGLGKLGSAGRTTTLNNSGSTLKFSRNDTYGSAGTLPTDTITANAGTTVTNGASYNTLGALNLNDATLTATGGANVTYQAFKLSGAVTVTGASAINSNTTSNSFNGIHLGQVGTGQTTFNVVGVSGTLAVSAVLLNGNNSSSATTAGLIKSGAGTMTLTAANTYAGTTNLNAGTVAAGTNTSFGTGTIDFGGGTIASSSASARTFTNTVALSTTGVFGSAGTGNLLFSGGVLLGNAAGGAKTITVNNTLTEFSGVLASTDTTGSLTKNGAGTLILSGTNTYLKKTVVATGTLVTNNASALGAGNVSLAGGTLQVGNGSNQLTLGSAANLITTAATASVLKFNANLGADTGTGAPANLTLAGGGKYDFSAGSLTLDLNSLFNTAGTYHLIAGGTGNTEAGSYAFANNDTTNFGFSFANGDLLVTAVPEPSTYGLLGAGALAAVAMVRRRRKVA